MKARFTEKQMLNNAMLPVISSKNGDRETLFAIGSRTMVERVRQEAVVHLCEAHNVSQRRASHD